YVLRVTHLVNPDSCKSITGSKKNDFRDEARPVWCDVDPSVVDTIIAESHDINDKQVEIKRTIREGSAESKDLSTKGVFVGGIPTVMDDDEFKGFFSKYRKKAEPKKPSRPASGPAYGNESRGRAYNDIYDGGFGNSYNNFGNGWGFVLAPYRSSRGMSYTFCEYGYGDGESCGR
uniref:RRM domain-containing protein n=1 Tax=Solanum lycopersicum TaxID=4081 RepID=A0A3Q7J806_SOLLC